MIPVTWWHCSSRCHGERLAVDRRPPLIRGENEPATPRLCVSKTIAGCFTAAIFNVAGPVWCYRTQKPARAIVPRNVWDADWSSEGWLIPPMELILDRAILPDAAMRAQAATILYHQESRQGSNGFLKICQRAIAHRELGGPAWEARMLSRMLKVINVTDPEEYILAAAVRLKGAK